MKTKVFQIILFLFTFLVSQAQLPLETILQGNLITAGPKQNIPLGSDGPFPIGFNFSFFGISYTDFYVSANGLVMFTDPDGQYNTEVTIPNVATPNNYIAPFWDNLYIIGKVLYTTIGASPNKICIIQFMNMAFDPVPLPLGTFQVILYETSNVVQLQYRLIVDPYAEDSHGGSATIGLENSTGTAGALYHFRNGDAVHSGDAISFTPSGSTYDVNSNAGYDGFYLTTSISLPDPSIVSLLNPSSDAVIGSSHTFQWAASSYVSQYYLLIDTLSSLATADYYYPGSNLTYDITGLTLDKTYYWSVFAENSTAMTWCESRRFSTNVSPPLIAVPLTIWTEQGQDKTIKLLYSGGDASPKTAVVTTLPAPGQGQLFQYNAGSRGSEVTVVPTVLSDPDMNLIYSASGSSGNGVGNFNFKISDSGGASPEATITVNVSPPGVPNVLYLAKKENVEIQLDRIMADPSGKQNQFEVKVNGTPVTPVSVALKTGDPYTLVLNLATPLSGTETVLASYTQGDVTSMSGGFLFSFSDQSVTLTAQTINFSQSLTKKYNESPLALTATASSSLEITYSSSNTSVATVNGNILTFLSLGSSYITAWQAGNTTFAPARFIKPLTVSKGDQIITFNALPDKNLGDEDFNLTATATSGLSVSFSSDNITVATVTGNTVHITGVGTSVITASQSGSTLWNPATDVPQTLTVNNPAGLEDHTISQNSFNVYVSTSHINIQPLADDWDGKTGSVKVVDITGKPVQILRNIVFSKNSLIRIQNPYTKGLYVVEIRSEMKKFVEKVVVR